MKEVIFLSAVLFSAWSAGQDCKAQEFFEAGPPPCSDILEGVQCVNLDMTDSYDFEGKEFIFIWDMGDGNQVEGTAVQYCYQKGGTYEAALTLIDPVTKINIERELVVDIFIKGESKLALDSVERKKVGEPFTPTYEMILPDDYVATNYFWSFGNGQFSCDPNPSVTYAANGKNQLLLNVQVVNKSDTLYLCDERVIEVGSSDPSGGLLDDLFENITVDARFLDAPVTYQLLQKNEDKYSFADQGNLESGMSYVLVAYRGNKFLVTQPATGSSASEILSNINAEAEKLASSEPEVLQSIIFDLNETDLSRKNKKELQRNAEKLANAPFFKIMIGSYTHSGGSFDRNRRLSISRSELLNGHFLEEGITADRLSIADPNNQRALINTCLTGGNCDYEDEALNRRADFKIVGFSIN